MLTVRAAALIRRLAVLAYPQTVGNMARRIAAPYIDRDIDGGTGKSAKKELPLPLPINKGERERAVIYRRNADLLGEVLRRGEDVGFLCLGDPLLYGSFIPLLRLLGGEFAIEVVPGVNSFSAAAAHHRRPLASGDESLLITPMKNRHIAELLKLADNAVVMKPGKRAEPLPLAEPLADFDSVTYGDGYFSLTLGRKK